MASICRNCEHSNGGKPNFENFACVHCRSVRNAIREEGQDQRASSQSVDAIPLSTVGPAAATTNSRGNSTRRIG